STSNNSPSGPSCRDIWCHLTVAQMKTPFASLVFWDRHRVSEAVASSCASASCYCHSEDIGIVAVVIFELTLRDVERQIFFRNLMIAADNRPLEDRPEALNCLRMDSADNVWRLSLPAAP